MDKANKTLIMSFSFLMSSVLLASVLIATPAAGQTIPLLSDFAINVTSANDLTFTGLRNLADSPPGVVNITTAYVAQFPALLGLGLSGAVIKYGPNSINSIHSHPRGNEVLYLLQGTVVAGVIDTGNRLLTQTLYPGDAFAIPTGLLHFQINYSNETATALATFSNPNSGRVSVAREIFNSNPHVDVAVIERAFDLDQPTIERLFDYKFPI